MLIFFLSNEFFKPKLTESKSPLQGDMGCPCGGGHGLGAWENRVGEVWEVGKREQEARFPMWREPGEIKKDAIWHIFIHQIFYRLHDCPRRIT